VASFGQGCEGEPLLQAAVIERACRLIRQKTDRGTLHLNTNGSRPEWLPRLAEAGLDSVRISTNSFIPGRHHAYYRPETYGFEEMEDSVRAAAGAGLYTQLNYLVFPGVTDREAEVEALLDFCGRTGVHVLQMKNLCIDPELYLDTLDEEEGETGEAVGMTRLLGILEEEAPEVALRYFNRPRDEWHLDPGASPASSPPPSAPPPAGEKG
jgi:molybdenum cofactor biosynthesis enzyme MoaA